MPPRGEWHSHLVVARHFWPWSLLPEPPGRWTGWDLATPAGNGRPPALQTTSNRRGWRHTVPGLEELRQAVAKYIPALRQPPGRASLPKDAVAGLNTAIAAVPTSMADSLLVGVNPLYGLYACLVGPLVGGATSSTQLMVITATTAASLTAGQALASVPSAGREQALGALVILTGVTLLLLGWLGLGRLMRFVSYSVMTGLLSGISVLIVLSQLPAIAGYAAGGSNRLAQTLDLLVHLRFVDLRSVSLAALTLVLAVVLPRTPLRHVGILLAMIVPSVLAPLLNWHSVPIVATAGQLARGLPALRWPSFAGVNAGVVTGALSVAVIILVQSAGVSQEAPNPDETPVRLSRDFVAQGAANVAAGLAQALPVGGSVTQTTLSVISGARTRWSVMLSGIWMGVILLIATGWVAQVTMPALEALLVLSGISSFRRTRVVMVWQAGWHARAAGLATFVAALLLPIQAAVGIGIALSGVLYVAESSADVTVMRLQERDDGSVIELAPPRRLSSDEVLVLQVYGHLFYASAATLERLLPPVHGAQRAGVILRLRGYAAIGASLLDVLANYSHELESAGGRLYLSGLGRSAREELERSEKLDLQIFAARKVVGQSTRSAYADAQEWLVRARSR